LFEQFSYPDYSLWTSALIEFRIRYETQITSSITVRQLEQAGMDEKREYYDWVIGWMLAKRKIGYLANYICGLSNELEASRIDLEVNKYLSKMIISARSSFWNERSTSIDACSSDDFGISEEFLYENRRGSRKHGKVTEDGYDEEESVEENEEENHEFDPSRIDSDFETQRQTVSSKKKKKNAVPIDAYGALAADEAWDMDPSRISADNEEGLWIRKRMQDFLASISPRKRIVFFLKAFRETATDWFDSTDWAHLEALTNLPANEIKEEINEECRLNPGSEVRSIRSLYIAKLLGLSRSNVDQIYSRMCLEVRSLLEEPVR
jgi:hypothetical protein